MSYQRSRVVTGAVAALGLGNSNELGKSDELGNSDEFGSRRELGKPEEFGVPSFPGTPDATGIPDELGVPDVVRTFRAMATDVTMQLVGPDEGAQAALERAEEIFHRVERACTRFDPTSPLMLANAEPRRWHQVPAELYDAIEAALTAHRLTDGLFDPRVLAVLQSWGYDRSLAFASGPVSLAEPAGASGAAAPGRRAWRPKFRPDRREVRLGDDPIDLGGIGKGLAVSWAGRELAPVTRATLIEAGGDILALGAGPLGTGWRVAIEDPTGSGAPLAVLNLVDAACATSSVRVRKWRVAQRDVHHLVDPRTGQPGGGGLLAVTVVDDDPARAEVWSKALFLTGRAGLRALADERGVAAMLVDSNGDVGLSRAMRAHVTWQAPRGW